MTSSRIFAAGHIDDRDVTAGAVRRKEFLPVGADLDAPRPGADIFDGARDLSRGDVDDRNPTGAAKRDEQLVPSGDSTPPIGRGTVGAPSVFGMVTVVATLWVATSMTADHAAVFVGDECGLAVLGEDDRPGPGAGRQSWRRPCGSPHRRRRPRCLPRTSPRSRARPDGPSRLPVPRRLAHGSLIVPVVRSTTDICAASSFDTYSVLPSGERSNTSGSWPLG